MHDAKGKSLAVGDVVVFPAKIVSLGGGDEACNVDIVAVGGMWPDGHHQQFGHMNTKQIYRANAGDAILVDTYTNEQGKTFLK